jgi:hypothetical protein
MKVWPIDPLVPRNLRLEVPEKLPQGSPSVVPVYLGEFLTKLAVHLVLGIPSIDGNPNRMVL